MDVRSTVGVAKIPRHGMAESGDTLEMIERPGGGFSVVLVDAQGSGRSAKTLSNMIGLYSNTKPRITEILIQPYTYLIVFSDGLLKAGE